MSRRSPGTGAKRKLPSGCFNVRFQQEPRWSWTFFTEAEAVHALRASRHGLCFCDARMRRAEVCCRSCLSMRVDSDRKARAAAMEKRASELGE